jgi:integrase
MSITCSCVLDATAANTPSRSQPKPYTTSSTDTVCRRGSPAAWRTRTRSYWATHLLEAGASIHEVSARLGHVDLRTTARYAAVREHSSDDLADTLDRSHQRAGRGW